MTIEEYEKKKLEDRKSLEAFRRPEQRTVEDKDFESMQLIGKKKEDSELVSKGVPSLIHHFRLIISESVID